MAGSLMQDTDDATFEVYVGMIRQMTPSQRIARVFELCQLQQAMQEAGVRQQHPDADAEEIFLRTAARKLSRQEMIDVYGWDPERHR